MSEYLRPGVIKPRLAWIVAIPVLLAPILPAACATSQSIDPNDVSLFDAGYPSGSAGTDGGVARAGQGGNSGAGGDSTGGTVAMGGSSGSGNVGASNGGASGGKAGSSGGAAMGGTGPTDDAGSGDGGSTSTGGGGAGGRATGGTGSGGKTTGGAGGQGTGGGVVDTDGDGITDADETNDGSDWTDPAVFNGLHVERGNQCTTIGSCNENNTLQKVNNCMQRNVDEQLDQRAGWDWENPPDDICSTQYGFAPNWTGCDSTWAARWTGCVHFETAGPHCFAIGGGTNRGCAALYFDGNTGDADVQSNDAAKCFMVAAGNYPLTMHYTMDNGSSSSMHVRYCDAKGGTTCTPTDALPASMLRTKCP